MLFEDISMLIYKNNGENQRNHWS